MLTSKVKVMGAVLSLVIARFCLAQTVSKMPTEPRAGSDALLSAIPRWAMGLPWSCREPREDTEVSLRGMVLNFVTS